MKVTQSCLILCDPMDSPWNSPGQNTGVGSLSLLQGIFPTQGSNPGIKPRFPALQMNSLPAEPQGKPKNTGVAGLSLLQRIFLIQELNWGLLHCRWILYQLSYQGSPKIFMICYSRSLRVLFSHLVFNSPGIYFVCGIASLPPPLLPWRPARCPEATPERPVLTFTALRCPLCCTSSLH